MPDPSFVLNDSLSWLGMAFASPAAPSEIPDAFPLSMMSAFAEPTVSHGWREINGIAPVAASIPFWPVPDPTAITEGFTLADSLPLGTAMLVVKNEPLYVAQRLAEIEDRLARTVGTSGAF